MTFLIVNYSRKSRKGQLKIQQMALMLVGVVIFFAMVGIVYFTISVSRIEADVKDLRAQEASDIARSLSKLPEFSFDANSDCSSCIDLDKVLMLKENKAYDGLWNLNYLMVEVVGNFENVECTRANYPDCGKITIVDKGDKTSKTAFVTLVRWDGDFGLGGFRKSLGRVHVSAKSLE